MILQYYSSKESNSPSGNYYWNSVPGLPSGVSLRIPEKAICVTISLDDPNRVRFRCRQVVTLLHHPPPCSNWVHYCT